MGEIVAKDWLEHHSLHVAQECAIRLAACSHAVLPSDKNLQFLVSGQMIADILAFALHARRVMESRNDTNASIATDPLWPASPTNAPDENLWGVLGKIVHADKIEVLWEQPDIKPNPYTGRSPRFAGAIAIKSGKGSTKIPVGAIVAAFIGSILNRSSQVQ